MPKEMHASQWLSVPRPTFAASHALGAAALAGLLSVVPACTSSERGNQPNGLHDAGVTSTGGSSGGTASGGTSAGGESSVGGADASVVAQGGTAGHATDSDAARGGATSDAATASDGPIVCDAAMEAGIVTSSQVVADMTLELFTTQCDARGGVLEIHPHCGGSNSCKGMSYDTGTQVLSEHSCRGMNACAGYSCIICA